MMTFIFGILFKARVSFSQFELGLAWNPGSFMATSSIRERFLLAAKESFRKQVQYFYQEEFYIVSRIIVMEISFKFIEC